MLIILSFIVIAHASQLHYVADPVEPGSTALIYGSGLANMTLTACAIGGASGGCASWPSVQSWDASLKATVPANSEAAVYSISVNDSQTLFLNAPTYQWHVGVGEVPGSAAPGTTLRVFGANLAWNLGARNCPTLGMGASNSTPAPPLPGVAALLINNDGPQAEGLTTYYSDVTQSHYLSAGCQGCSGSENYQPLRVEGYAFPSPCGETACVELLTYYSQASGTNLVVPAGWGPIPEGFSLWNGNVAYILPVNYSGPSATVSLELWKGVAVAGGAPDYWTLSSSASRAEASAKGYTQVGGELGKLLLSPGGGISPTSKQYSLPVLLASCYRLDLELPSSLPPGAYSLFVNNGLWRDWAPPSLASLPPPLISSLSVLSPPTWPSTLFTVGVTPGCENVTTCLDTASIAGGGEVLLPPGIYQMPSRQALVLGPRVALLGSGQGDGGSVLVWSSNTGGGPIGAGGFITGGPSPWRIANLLVVFQSGMWGQPGVLIPAGSVGARVENVTVFINTTDRSATGSGITVGEGGNSTLASQWIVTGSTFYQAPGVSCPINAWPRSCTFYIIAADHGVFSNNTVIAGCQSWSVVNAKNLFMSDLYVQSVGQNSDGNGFGNFYYPQVLENIYVGNTYNVGNWLSTERWETMTFDGLGMVWNSNISSAIGTTLYLPGDPIRNGYDYTGQMVAVLGGPGMGQIRRVKAWNRGPGGQSTWNLDSPWTTPLDHTTIVAILGYRGSITFESNTYLNGTNFQFCECQIQAPKPSPFSRTQMLTHNHTHPPPPTCRWHGYLCASRWKRVPKHECHRVSGGCRVCSV